MTAASQQTAIDTAQQWLESTNVSDADKAIITQMQASPAELTEAFYRRLAFGTGGMRAKMGIGSNMMNTYTVGMATQGLANYLLAQLPGQEINVVIAHDCRNNSPEFTQTAADVLSANGIHVHVFPELRPTPELSFAVRHLGAHAGIVITASHNPAEYNGYKVYWSDGAQIVAPHDRGIMAEVAKIETLDEVHFTGNADLIHQVSPEVDQAFVDVVVGHSVRPEVIAKQSDLSIVYTPLHGTGVTMVPRALQQLGFANVAIVDEQAVVDGDFPTVESPNPEETSAMKMALEKAKAIDADVVMATDPDSDRVGIGVKNAAGEWELLNGNQVAALLFDYILSIKQENGQLDGSQFTCGTIVTTGLLPAIAAEYGVHHYDTLTGFKWIGAKIKELEGQQKFLVGGEESYGYLVGDAVRDKDAIASCAMIAELCAYAKDNNMTLQAYLDRLYQKFGMYREKLVYIKREGQAGAAEIAHMMDTLRNNAPASFAGSPVVRRHDYQSGIATDVANGAESQLDLPKSNVLQFFTEAGDVISVRPSGTEPKIKFYLGTKRPFAEADDYDAVWDGLGERLDAIFEELS